MMGRVLRSVAAVAVSAFAAFSTPAFAADLGGAPKVPVPAGEPLLAQKTWAGWYLGGNLGGIIDGDGDVTGGGHLGHNWQNGKFVLGAEGDLDFADDPDVYGSVRGRVGIAFGRAWLLYGTAGIAIDDDDEGLVAGGGLEYKIADTTSIGVEALNYDLEDNFTVVRGRVTWHFGGGLGGLGRLR